MIGVPDERLGEELCAWIQLKAGETLTETELRDFCKQRVCLLCSLPCFIYMYIQMYLYFCPYLLNS